jgi:hypothetical protein
MTSYALHTALPTPSLLTLSFMQNVQPALCLHDYIQLKQHYKSIQHTHNRHSQEKEL